LVSYNVLYDLFGNCVTNIKRKIISKCSSSSSSATIKIPELPKHHIRVIKLKFCEKRIKLSRRKLIGIFVYHHKKILPHVHLGQEGSKHAKDHVETVKSSETLVVAYAAKYMLLLLFRGLKNPEQMSF
jgi:hypothetical protein